MTVQTVEHFHMTDSASAGIRCRRRLVNLTGLNRRNNARTNCN